MLWNWNVQARYVPSNCYGHDEPTMSFFSSAAGSGANARFKFTLPSDSSSYAQGQFYATFWIGGAVYDPSSTGGSSQAVLELQFYPAAPVFTGTGSGAKDCAINGDFFPSYSAGANQWFACAIVWQLVCSIPCFTITEDAAYARAVDAGTTSSILVFHSGDALFVNLSGTAQSTTNGWRIAVSDATSGGNGVNVLKNGSLVLSPYYATATTSHLVGWAASGLGAVAFAYEVGHALSNIAASCTPGDLSCDSYWPGRWAATGPAAIAIPRLGSGSSPRFATSIGFSSSQGGEAEVNASTCGAPSTSTAKNCLYPWYSYRAASYALDFGTGGATNQTYSYGTKYQFPSSVTSSGAYAKNYQPAPWGTVGITVIGAGAVDLNAAGTTTPVALSASGTASVPVADGRYWLNTSSPGCSPVSQSAYLRTRAVVNLVVTCPAVWTKLAPAMSPSARGYEGLTYDAKDGYDLLFGGYNTSTGALGDTWNYSHGAWTRLSPAPSPPARSSMGMVYDGADHYVLLFGGSTANSSLADTWTYAGGTWTQLAPVSSPSARSGFGMAYDALDGYVLLFGGIDSTGHLVNDTWKFVAGAWTNITPSVAPSPRVEPAVTYDPHDGYVLLFGGSESTSGPPILSAETWSFSGGVWSKLVTNGSPSARSDAGAVYDATLGHVVLFGGLGAGGLLDETWSYAGGTWTNRTVGIAPSARSDVGMTYDGATLSTLLFGGAASPYSAQTWKYT